MSVRLDGEPIAKNGDKADPLLNVSFRAVPVVASLDGDVCGRKPCCQVHAPYIPVAGGIACRSAVRTSKLRRRSGSESIWAVAVSLISQEMASRPCHWNLSASNTSEAELNSVRGSCPSLSRST